METLLRLEIHLICILHTGLLLLWAEKRDTCPTQDMWQIRMLIVFLTSFLSGLFRVILERAGSAAALTALETLSFLGLSGGLFCWRQYADALTGALTDGKRRDWRSLLPWTAAVLPALINLFTGWMFTFDEGLCCHRHWLFYVAAGLLFALCLPGTGRLIRKAGGEAIPSVRTHLLLTAAFPLCLPVGLLLLWAGEETAPFCAPVSAGLLCIQLGISRYQVSLDPLTQVNNRQNLLGYMQYRLKNRTEGVVLMMIDLDFFKTINDSYGHLAGDQALIQLAGALKRACAEMPGRPYIARYGGDEFIILMDGGEEEVRALSDGIRAALREKPFARPLQVSIGCAKWEKGMDPRALIAAADASLYEQKRLAGVGR